MNGAFGSPITPFAEWFSSTMMNARSSLTWLPPDPWLATGAAPLDADSPTVSAAATPATAPVALPFRYCVQDRNQWVQPSSHLPAAVLAVTVIGSPGMDML